MRGQLASSVRGRWNSAGTSGREQRKVLRRGQGKGAARTLWCGLSSDGQPCPKGVSLLIWGEGGQLSKCMGREGQVLPLWPALVNNNIISLYRSLFFVFFSLSSFSSFFFSPRLVSKVQLG